MVILSITISFLSLAVGGLALYFSQLRKAKIQSLVGPQIDIYHHDYETGGSTGFIVPVSFLNNTPSTGTVIKASIVISQRGNDEERFYMQWQKFDFLNEESGKWDHESDAHPLVLSARNGVHKNIWCMWHAFNGKKLHFKNGTYEMSFYFWTAEKSKPSKVIKNFYISEEVAEYFSKMRDAKQTSGIKIVLDKELEFNRLMNNDEFVKLL